MSMYPSLEDMKVDQMATAQNPYELQLANQRAKSPNLYPNAVGSGGTTPTTPQGAMYPSLGEYMGLELTDAAIAANMPEYMQIANLQPQQIVSTRRPGYNSNMVAPLSGQSLGLQRAQVTNGIRELTVCKDKDGRVGLRVKPINNGIFVCLVIEKSPAAIAGIRFGDQILQVNGVTVAGYTMDKVHDLLRKSPVNGISIVVRDRPFERTLTLHKDSTGHVGFQFKNGKIISLVKDSSAARNGVLTEHQLLEVEGQNVVAMKDKGISKIMEEAGGIVTITVIPSFVYEHMIKKMNTSLLKDLMDHSIPTI